MAEVAHCEKCGTPLRRKGCPKLCEPIVEPPVYRGPLVVGISHSARLIGGAGWIR